MNHIYRKNRLKYILAFLFVALLFWSCNQKEKTTINGILQNITEDTEVTLFLQSFDKATPIGVAKATPKKPNFSFKVGKLIEPTFYQLKVGNGNNMIAVLLIEPQEKVKLEIDTKNFLVYDVQGSEGSHKTQLLSQKLARSIKSLDSLTLLYNKTVSKEEREKLSVEYSRIVEQQREFSTKFIWENPRSRASAMALYQKFSENHFVFDRAEDTHLFTVVATQQRAMYPESAWTKGMLNDIKNQEKIVTEKRFQQLFEMAESNLPEIALPNTKGDTIKLSSLKGKVVLLDFWASYSQASLMENRTLLDIYRTYKPKGFEIYQVSFDIKRESWIEAIGFANLPWINVCDLRGSSSLVAKTYNVTRVPSNYLIDKNYNIVGKNLFGDDLNKELKELLK